MLHLFSTMKTQSSTTAWSKARKSIVRANAGVKRSITLPPLPHPPTLVGGRLVPFQRAAQSPRTLGPILEEDSFVKV
ncbi:hypothetical protein SDRG_11590 [Saprolegnia diclina VS20]|uniref:Uncharacterized protein n=1 Tax=Saprolegnia diclina (strain VS20) TaxID=1156394 RepID=T0QBC0_SAPDV|nr:hypothetical protein SDRG_11590 [Saprolegnia diclina VS20]EQC30830.1 hypothetical protein SDRG_11590 [Saprolegnia diclina VS20]|eukprot:XP_008615854.1 hypothetical protein SDRG_11590 [Saprolegnia diclina VS20]